MNNEPDTNSTPEPMPIEEQPPVEMAISSVEAPAQITTAPEPVTKKRSPKLLIGGILAAAIVLVGAGGVFGYTMWYQNPDKVVHDAVINAFKAKSVSSTGSLTYTGETFSMDLALDAKGTESNTDIALKAKISVDAPEMKQTFEANGIARVIDGTLYVKISGVESIVKDVAQQSGGLIPEYATAIFDKIEDKWISINPADYQDMNDEVAKQQTCVSDLMKKIQSDKAMSNEVVALYRKNQIVTIKEELGTKNVNGVSSLGYHIDFSQDAATKFAQGLNDTALGKELKGCDDTIDFNDIANNISNQSGDMSNTNGKVELWVSQLGHEITEISLSGTADEKNSFSAIFQPQFNKNITIETPSDATSLKTVLEEIQQSIMEYYSGQYSADILTMPTMLEEELEREMQSAA